MCKHDTNRPTPFTFACSVACLQRLLKLILIFLRKLVLILTPTWLDAGFEVPHAFPEDFAGVFGMDIRSCIAHYKQKFDR